MFCRNCGKELIGSPEFCPGCGAKPTRGTSFCSYCGAPTTPLTRICYKCGVRVVGGLEAGLQEMNWFQRHLNWTVLLALVGSYALGLMAAFAVGVAIGVADPYVSLEAAGAAGGVTGVVVYLAILVPTWGWVLRRKNRSLWWLLLALFVPFGWIAMFVLENQSR
jgi:hypothetical protein